MLKLLKNISFFLVFFSFLSTWAQVDHVYSKRLFLPEKNLGTSFGDYLTYSILPSKLESGENSAVLLSKIADNSLSLVWNNSPLRYSPVGKTAETVEKKVNVEAHFKDEEQVEHKFNLKLLAIQSLAKIEYKGWMSAALNYDIRQARSEAELIESLSNNKDLILSHSIKKDENKSAVSLRWKW